MRYAAISLTANTLGSIGLFFLFRSLGWMPHVGIAIATALGGWINALLLWRTLAVRGHFIADATLKRTLPLIVLASAMMGAGLWLAAPYVAPLLDRSHTSLVRIGAVLGLAGAGLVLYGVFAWAVGAFRLSQLRSAMRR